MDMTAALSAAMAAWKKAPEDAKRGPGPDAKAPAVAAEAHAAPAAAGAAAAERAGLRDEQAWAMSAAAGDTSAVAGDARRAPLAAALSVFRERTESIAAEIRTALPDFVVHSPAHHAELWDRAALAAGHAFPLSPEEAFVFGAALLLHDLGVGVAALPEGGAALKADPAWADIVSAQFRKRMGRAPSEEERAELDRDVERECQAELLGMRHPSRLENVALAAFRSRAGAGVTREQYLIDDPVLRARFGTVIGEVAASRRLSVDEARHRFAPHEAADGVDPLKLALLLRAADCLHFEARRAPGNLRADRRAPGYEADHWTFTRNTSPPRLEGERVVVTTAGEDARPFPAAEAGAWWLGFELLEAADRELRRIDSLLQDLSRPCRLAARGVAGVEEPERLARYIPTEDWLPINARVQVTNVAGLVRSLGGEHLYGSDPAIPLRELIQNGADAVRARRLLEKLPEGWGEVTVRRGTDGSGPFIEVEDTGVGMSTSVLTGPFLDFGTSFWGTTLMRDELPGLTGTDFQSTGRFGIGFFSVFMWGERVRVVTRRYEADPRDTHVLEFGSGFRERPLLRRAAEEERREAGGTVVRVWTGDEPVRFPRPGASPGATAAAAGAASGKTAEEEWDLGDMLTYFCPTLDVNLHIEPAAGVPARTVIRANDWVTMPGGELLRRLWGHERRVLLDRFVGTVGEALRTLHAPGGEVIGRACVFEDTVVRQRARSGVAGGGAFGGLVTVGGFRTSGLQGIVGVLAGEPRTAARDSATPLADDAALAAWATAQARLVPQVRSRPADLLECAALIRGCGGAVGALPVARLSGRHVGHEELVEWARRNDGAVIAPPEAPAVPDGGDESVEVPDEGVILTGFVRPTVLSGRAGEGDSWPSPRAYRGRKMGYHTVTLAGAVIEALAEGWGSTPEDVYRLARLETREVGASASGARVTREAFVLKRP